MSERKKIQKGNSDFKYIVGNNGYFVDKTLLVKEFHENDDHVLLIPRPRRFGKTLNLSMIEHFFDINKKESASLFTEFKISAEKGFCQAHQNKYPVINLSLKSVRGNDWEGCLLHLKRVVSEAYQEHKYLLKSDKLEDYEKQSITEIILKKGGQPDYAFSLFNLSKYLKAHFGAEAIILVDEYDTPIIDGYKEKYYGEVIKFMQVFMGSAFKGNPYLHKGLITGIMRIARESIFSEMNNIGVYTITSLYFADKFGFTETETKEALAYFGLEAHFPEVQKWYNGYQFGNTGQIYNPWSIVNYISRHEEGFKAYWINTGTDSLIKERILEPDIDQTYDTLQQLVAGQTVEKVIDESFVFSDFATNRELLWTLLAFSGYLTQVKEVRRNTYLLKIPNYEIKTVFQDIVMAWLHRDVKVQRELLISTAEHLVNNRLQAFEKGFKKIMGDTFSYFDTGGEAEKAYQAYVLGLLAVIGDDYLIRSNRESGEGRYDIMLMPHDKARYGVVIEIKRIEGRKKKETEEAFSKRINATLTEAAHQIEQKNYYKELLAHQIEKIIQLPIVFAGKNLLFCRYNSLKKGNYLAGSRSSCHKDTKPQRSHQGFV